MLNKCLNEWMNTPLVGLHNKSIYFNQISLPPIKHSHPSWCLTHSLWFHVHSFPLICKEQGGSIWGCDMYHNRYRFHFVPCGSRTSSPCNLEGISMIICAFLMPRSSPPAGACTQANFLYFEEGSLHEWHYWEWVELNMWKEKSALLFAIPIPSNTFYDYFFSIPWIYHKLLQSKKLYFRD